MPAVTRHRLLNAGKPAATHLPAETCFAKTGEATWPVLAGLAYSVRMGGSTYRAPAGTYWRRRFLLLVAGLTIFGLAAWGLSTALAVGPSRIGQGRHDRVPASHEHQSVRPEPKPTPRAARSPDRGGSGTNAGQANGHGTILPAFCARRDVVLSLFTAQTQYSRQQQPVFDVNVVSTGQAECSFNIGSQHLTLVIEEGPARIWSSADCAVGTGSLIAALKRGVPTVLTFSWQRRTSAPGCSVRARAVPPGIYTAFAVDGPLTSAPVTIRLRTG